MSVFILLLCFIFSAAASFGGTATLHGDFGFSLFTENNYYSVHWKPSENRALITTILGWTNYTYNWNLQDNKYIYIADSVCCESEARGWNAISNSFWQSPFISDQGKCSGRDVYWYTVRRGNLNSYAQFYPFTNSSLELGFLVENGTLFCGRDGAHQQGVEVFNSEKSKMIVTTGLPYQCSCVTPTYFPDPNQYYPTTTGYSTTGYDPYLSSDSTSSDESSSSSNEIIISKLLVEIIIGVLGAIFIVLVIIAIILCRRRTNPQMTIAKLDEKTPLSINVTNGGGKN